jgi:uncharacterized protein YdeI (YjbR/CyaY-like superfamily)
MDARVDAYIDRQGEFARPILAELRRRIHAAHPGLAEDIRWSMPAFLWNGRQIANMAGFKAHCALSFWHVQRGEQDQGKRAMGQFGRIASITDLPDEAKLASMVREAVRLADSGVKASMATGAPKAPIAMPEDFAARLAEAGATAAFEVMPPGARREYLEWITTAKQAATRERRIATATAQIGEGKKLHWRYEKC